MSEKENGDGYSGALFHAAVYPIGRFNPVVCFGENGTRQAGFRAYAAGEPHAGESLVRVWIGRGGTRARNKSTRMSIEQTGTVKTAVTGAMYPFMKWTEL